MKTDDHSAANRHRQQLCTFRINHRLFGVRITDVKEVQPLMQFTSVHHAPKTVKGIVNIRGQIHLVIDFRALLGFKPADAGPDSRIILFKSRVGESFGILVDGVGDVTEVEDNRIETLGAYTKEVTRISIQKILAGLVTGICKLDKTLLVIIDAAALPGKIYENEK